MENALREGVAAVGDRYDEVERESVLFSLSILVTTAYLSSPSPTL